MDITCIFRTAFYQHHGDPVVFDRVGYSILHYCSIILPYEGIEQRRYLL